MSPTLNRRPVGSRSVAAFHRLAAALVRFGLTPNQVSCLSAVFALGGAVALASFPGAAGAARYALLAATILGIQLRLLCNLLDGLMAVEGGKKTAAGELFNDFPDRLSDLALILGAGVAAASPTLAWVAATLAVLTAYLRVLGASMGVPALFLGPMAKQHRMAALNFAVVAAGAEAALGGTGAFSLHAGLAVIAGGSLVTCARRAAAILARAGASK